MTWTEDENVSGRVEVIVERWPEVVAHHKPHVFSDAMKLAGFCTLAGDTTDELACLDNVRLLPPKWSDKNTKRSAKVERVLDVDKSLCWQLDGLFLLLLSWTWIKWQMCVFQRTYWKLAAQLIYFLYTVRHCQSILIRRHPNKPMSLFEW